MRFDVHHLFYEPKDSFERLVFDIHLVNHQWHGLENLPGAAALCDELRALKDMRQLRLLRFHRDLVELVLSEDKPGTFLIRLRCEVGGYDHAAHIPIKKVPLELLGE